MLYVGNAFSLQMLDTEVTNTVTVTPISPDDESLTWDDYVSIMGHEDTARALSNLTGRELCYNRQSVSLTKDDQLLVAQISNGRLPEGCTTLPDNVKLSWLLVTVT